ncbi:hypothetical protein HYFRA_00004639 [Hymenoscyphus fraxineus]|uniref:NAD(P)-binding protein n=1 Tax=Hymenoscyphus fraxineus TaxID=746836 RepID=A0A9N9KVU0_9HELO|nr:hypothetical protein HYFRA_00004639 [Hymenoscyphus fraxineus]
MEHPLSSLPLKGKTAIITGSSRGLGAGMALELAKRGADIVITYTSPTSTPLVTSLTSLITSLPHNPSVLTIQADLLLPSTPSKIISSLKTWRGPNHPLTIDILVNNAGTEIVAPLSSIKVQDFEKVYKLNVLAPLLLTQAILPYLPPRGRIINISSVGARAGFANLGLYCSSKAALEGLTRCWAQELGGNGTTVNVVSPGPVQSAMLENIPKEIVERQRSETAVEKRLGSVEEVARVVGWLAGEESGWVSGQCVSASGGWAMY